MKKTLKSILSIALSLLILLAAIPFANISNIMFKASATVTTEGYYTYEISNGEATITAVDSNISGKITVPTTLGNYPVTNIDEYAFYECDSITTVTISGEVVNIGANAFGYCDNLKSVIINAPVMKIEHGAFAYCEKLENIILPDTLENIGYWILLGTQFVSDETNWEDGALYIGSYLIYGIKTVGDYRIKDGTKIIADQAFSGNDSITSVYLPNSVSVIGISAFAHCSKLKNITLSACIKEIGETAFHTNRIQEIEIPGKITNVNELSFSACGKLEKIIFLNPKTPIIIDRLSDVGSSFPAAVYGYEGSTAQEYAKATGRKFISLGNFEDHIHDFESNVNLSATCNQKGEKYLICRCGYDCTEEIPMINHTWSNWTVTKPATYEASGTEERLCSVCKKSESRVVEKLEYENIAVDNSEEIKTFGEEAILALPENTIETLLTNVKGNVSITDKDGKAVDSKDIIKSGMVISLQDKNGKVIDTMTVVVPGDNDGDGKITASDARTALRASVDLDKLNDWQEDASNVDAIKKNEITAADARFILRASVGLENLKDWIKVIK